MVRRRFCPRLLAVLLFGCLAILPARAEQITIPLGMSFDKVVEAIRKCGGEEDNRSDVKPPGYTWRLPDHVTLDLGERYGKLSYLAYQYGNEAGYPIQSLTLDTGTHKKIRDERLPPDAPIPVESVQWQVRMELLVAVLPQEKALALLPDLSDEGKVDAAYTQIMAAIARKEARLIGYPVIQTLSGMKATSETIFEKIYPCQFEPLQEPAPDRFKLPNPPTGEVGRRSAVPTAFEKRNVGITLEFEPVVREGGKWIHLNIQPQRVDFDGMDTYPFYKGPEGSGQVEQPRFYTTKDSTSLQVRHGQRVLLGFHKSLRGDEVEIHLIQALAIPTP